MISHLSISAPSNKRQVKGPSHKFSDAGVILTHSPCSHYFSLLDPSWVLAYTHTLSFTCRLRLEWNQQNTYQRRGTSLYPHHWPPNLHCNKPQLEPSLPSYHPLTYRHMNTPTACSVEGGNTKPESTILPSVLLSSSHLGS